jgi:hypothetical protein
MAGIIKEQTSPPKKTRLSKYLFWDIDMRKLNYESRAPFILERVFTLGMQEDEWKIIEYYGKDRIKREVAFNDYFLVGETALALQLGHRKSDDIDLFTQNEL